MVIESKLLFFLLEFIMCEHVPTQFLFFFFCLIFQVDLRIEVGITGIATRGYKQNWVKTYYIEYSNDGSNWLPHIEPGESDKVCSN